MGKRARLEHRAERRRRQPAGAERGCLFCQRTDGAFTSEEHIVPESMGNTDGVLPRGVVCDRCNNGPLSVVDKALCDFWPVQNGRVLQGIRAKSGKVPEVRFTKGVLRHTGDASVLFELQSARDKTSFREIARRGDEVEVKFEISGGRKLTPRYVASLSNAVLKTAFEAAWLDHGNDMLASRFDHVRRAVIGEPRDGYLVMTRRGTTFHRGLTTHYGFTKGGNGDSPICVLSDFYGVGYATDSRLPTPPYEVPEDQLIVLTFNKSDFNH